MKYFLLSLLCATAFSASANDTLIVEKVNTTRPIAIHKPYMVDEVNNKNVAFDVKATLNEHANIGFINQELTGLLSKGDAITAVDSAETLRVLHFNIRTDRYTSLNLVVNQLKSYKTFVNNKPSGNQLTLTPGDYSIKLLSLTQANSNDSLNISITGKSLDGVEVNPQTPRAYLMKEMMQGERTYNARISPTGKYLVAYYQNTFEDGKSTYTTILTNLKTGKDIARYAQYVDYKWLENEDIIYFTRTTNGNKQLLFLNPETMAEEVRADYLPSDNFTLSPTLDYLIVSKNEEGNRPQGSLKKLAHPDDRMNGNRNRTALWRYDFATRKMQRLTYGKTRLHLADISKDGKQLLIITSTMEPSRKPYSRNAILRMDAFSASVDTLISDTAWIAGAMFAPNGQQLLIKASTDAFNKIGSEIKDGQHPNAFDYRLYLYDIPSKTAKMMLPNFAPSVDGYQWNSQDNQIYFTATDGGGRSVCVLNPKTLKVHKFELPLDYVSTFSLAGNQKIPTAVITGQNGGQRAREMFHITLNPQKTKAQRIGEIDFDEMYKDVAIGTCHDWKFQSSRGDSINGFYYLPANFDANQKYPLIVYYYGGCTPSTKLLEINYPFQVFASLGYVVYVVQPSGAIGFGQEFAARHVNTWGDMSSDDIIEGTQQFCKEHSFVNADKIGCIGASYGGFMTQYLQTKTDIFAAAIAHAGISNIASYWGGGYWGYTYGEIAQYQSFPWNNPDLYTKHSPLFNADKINTPILLIHGTVDTNVPPFESQQLYTALRILGKEVEYLQVDGQDHVITDWNKRLEWQNAIFAWFAKHLKDQPEWWDESSKKW